MVADQQSKVKVLTAFPAWPGTVLKRRAPGFPEEADEWDSHRVIGWIVYAVGEDPAPRVAPITLGADERVEYAADAATTPPSRLLRAV